MLPKFKGTVEQGKLKLKEPEQFRQYIARYEGKEIFVVVGRERKTRSERTNRFYWAYLHLLGEETGDDPIYLHEICKRKFLPPRFVKVRGKEYKLPATTTALTSDQFSVYIMRIEQWTGIPAPDPRDYFTE